MTSSPMQDIQAAKAAADTAVRQKQHGLAVAKYDLAIELSEQHKEPGLLNVLYSNRSAAKLAQKDYQGALADAQASVAVDEKWLKGWYRSAKALQGLGKHDLAIQAAEKALQLEPNNTDVQKLLKELHQQQQQQQCGHGTQATGHTPQQQQQSQQQQPGLQNATVPWSQVNKLRASLHLQLLPQQLVAGTEYVPAADGVNSNLLILLHGLGDKPAAFTALAKRMCLPQTASLALSGPLAVPETDGGRAWFTAYDDDWELIQPRPGETRRIKSLGATTDLLQQQLLPALSAAGGWRPEQIHLFGFSQGGTVALEMARLCRGQQRLGGVVAASASLLEEQLSSTNSSSSSSGAAAAGSATDVLMTHGDRDDTVSRSLVNRTLALLKSEGCDVQLKTLPNKGHGMINSAEEMQACMQFWAARLKSRPADPEFVEVATHGVTV